MSVVVLCCLYIPLLALLWATVVCGVRWRRSHRLPPRFMIRGLRHSPRVVPQTLMASISSWGFIAAPGLPWNHALFDLLVRTGPFWWACMAAVWLTPVAVVYHLTRPRSALMRDADVSA